jgi:hypothetical protein
MLVRSRDFFGFAGALFVGSSLAVESRLASRPNTKMGNPRSGNDRGQTGYLESMADAQEMLDACRPGDAVVIGRVRSGNLVDPYRRGYRLQMHHACARHGILWPTYQLVHDKGLEQSKRRPMNPQRFPL